MPIKYNKFLAAGAMAIVLVSGLGVYNNSEILPMSISTMIQVSTNTAISGAYTNSENKDIKTDNKDNEALAQLIVYGTFGADKLIGCALLVRSDLPTRLELNPWLASVYVEPEYRNSSVATNLVSKIIEKSKILGFEDIYCFTYHAQTIYTRLGFRFVESSIYNGQHITIFLKQTGYA